jgi:cytidine deaminase
MTNQELIDKAIETINPQSSGNMNAGWVACALLTEQWDVFIGVCIDTRCSMWFCAEHNAAWSMITAWHTSISKIVAVRKNNESYQFLAPCGRCREFMYQINHDNLQTHIIINKDKVVTLQELLPYHNREQDFVIN